MPYFTEFFSNNPAPSFKSYLSHLKTKGKSLCEKDLKTYAHYYEVDLRWRRGQKNISREEVSDAGIAIDEFNNLTNNDKKAILMSLTDPATSTFNHCTIGIANANGSTFIEVPYSPSSPPAPQQQEPEPEQQQQQQHTYGGTSSERGKKRQVDSNESYTNKKGHVTYSIAADASDCGGAVIDEESEDMTSPDLVTILASFLSTSNSSDFHKWRLESQGIFHIGKNIRPQRDVPGAIYDELALEMTLPEFPISGFENYLRTTLFHDSYGTAAVATAIFSTTHLTDNDTSQTNFIMRALFILSENVHCRDRQPRLADSEVSYCYYTLWPFISLACNSLSGMNFEFKVGETYLKAIDCLTRPTPRYSADGTVYLAESGLELLLFEASGSLDTIDRPGHVYDHIKGAFGCYAMLMAILTKYPYADKHLMNDLRVLFLHAAANGNYVRLWVMKPCFDGSILTFERLDKVEITTSSLDKVMALKGMLERSMEAVSALRLSNDMNFVLLHESLEQTPLLSTLLKSMPIKPVKGKDCINISDLDPVSSLF